MCELVFEETGLLPHAHPGRDRFVEVHHPAHPRVDGQPVGQGPVVRGQADGQAGRDRRAGDLPGGRAGGEQDGQLRPPAMDFPREIESIHSPRHHDVGEDDVDHPNVGKVLSFGPTQVGSSQTCYLAMEYIEGNTLDVDGKNRRTPKVLPTCDDNRLEEQRCRLTEYFSSMMTRLCARP